VPELPDVAILADALDTSLAGRRLRAVRIPQSLVLRGTEADLRGLEGQLLVEVTRRGKFLIFAFERDRIVLNPMLSGRLGLAAVGNRDWPSTAAVLNFAEHELEPVSITARSRSLPEWPGSADWLPPLTEPVELRYRDSTRMGKLYLLPAGTSRSVAGWNEQGPDADDPELDLAMWRTRIARHSGELKNVLRNQQFVAGIGNAYSDEILWAAGLAPFRTRKSLAVDEVDALYRAMRDVLAWAIEELHRRVPPRLEVEQRDFLRAHHRGGSACLRCGSTISEITAGGSATSWCRGCQR
jgi:formamidopyrimidine-DNA glycosylase